MTQQTMSENIDKIALALSRFQGLSDPIYKSKTANVGQYKYKYADLSDIFGTISATLMGCELSISQFFTESNGSCQLITLLAHSSGQWIKSVLQISSHEKIQQLGSEITYLRRYALSSILGIAADDDEDGAAANEAVRKKETEKVKKLSKEQVNCLTDLLVQIEHEGFDTNFLKYYGVSKVEEISENHFKHAVNWLNIKINSKKEPVYENATA